VKKPETCTLCPRECGAERNENEGHGFCKMPLTPAVCRAALHFGEEPIISGSRGSGAVFFCGCTLRCCFCQNADISREYIGKPCDAKELAEIFARLESQGAHNINLVTATPFIPVILEAFGLYRPSVPVVFNSSGYEKVETLRMLEGFIDVYLPDFKYSSPDTAAKYSAAPDYPEKAVTAIGEMIRQTGPATFSEDGTIKRGTVIRHLLLPSNLSDTLGVIRLMKQHFPTDTLISLMRQYTPIGKPAFPELARRVTTSEYDRAVNALLDAGFTNGFTQERSAATEKYVPEWDLA